jgi:MoaA/NifB/PqqE/SkfB family radical SAM enzyme
MSNGLFARYCNVLLRSRFGVTLNKKGLWNYLKHYFIKPGIIIRPDILSPILMNLTITKRCNLKCPWCGGEKLILDETGRSLDKDMTADYVGKLLDTEIGKRLLLVTLTGGEPLLNVEIVEIVRVIKRRKLLCGIITNGLLLENRIDDLINAGLDELQVSLHDYEDAYKKLIGVIPGISKKIPVHGTYVLTKTILETNQQHVKEIINAAQEMGCRSLRINLCAPSTIGGDTSNGIYDDNHIYKQFVDALEKEKYKMGIFFPDPVKRNIMGGKDKNCKIPWQRIQINSLGQVSMCCYFRVAEERLGDFLADGDDKTYNNNVLLNIRKKLLSDDTDVYSFCKNCPALSRGYVTKI